MNDRPYDNCKYQICDLPGQCLSEGKCHHPKTVQPSPPAPDLVERVARVIYNNTALQCGNDEHYRMVAYAYMPAARAAIAAALQVARLEFIEAYRAETEIVKAGKDCTMEHFDAQTRRITSCS